LLINIEENVIIKFNIKKINLMNNNNQLKWDPTEEQIDNMILPAYTFLAKKSVEYIEQFECPPEYVADMLRDIADALISSHPSSDKDCSCC
tara:strand:- start:169 stop:441 length:273 start_codon:yes stop_codon:yes gene_type:complete